MAKLIKTFEKLRDNKMQVIHLTSKSVWNSRQVEELGYDDFEANLFINNKFIADISHVLNDAGVFQDMIDSVDWSEMYAEMEEEVCHD